MMWILFKTFELSQVVRVWRLLLEEAHRPKPFHITSTDAKFETVPSLSPLGPRPRSLGRRFSAKGPRISIH